MVHDELHDVIGEIEDVTGPSDLHLHVLKANDALGDVSFTDLLEDEEERITEWLEQFHDATAAIADDLGAASYELTLSGGPDPISFNVTFEE